MPRAKKRSGIANPDPLLPLGLEADASRKKRSLNPKQKKRRIGDNLVPSDVRRKVVKEAFIQQKEIENEEEQGRDDGAVENSGLSLGNLKGLNEYNDEDIHNFDGFSEKSESQYVQWKKEVEDEIGEDDEKLLEVFLSKDKRPQRTFADIIAEKVKENDAQFSSGVKKVPELANSIVELYKEVGELLSKYTSGKMPEAFKLIPSLEVWEEILHLTEPENWSPNAMLKATKIFASNLASKKVERFYRYVLLPRVREDIRKNKRLHFSMYQSLKEALYKPAAFNKGILFPLCESRACSLREAVIVGSIIEKMSIPQCHSSAALLKLAEMEYCGTTSYFMKLLIDKKYALPYRVIDALVVHFMKFYDDSRVMPVIWHQSLVAFAQRYKNELTKEDKMNLNALVGRQRHKLVTPDILRELCYSRNRGEEEDDHMSISSPVSVVAKAIQEDRFDIPEVPMEED